MDIVCCKVSHVEKKTQKEDIENFQQMSVFSVEGAAGGIKYTRLLGKAQNPSGDELDCIRQ